MRTYLRLTSSFFLFLFFLKRMAKNTSQGASSKHGVPKSPAPAPSPASASDDRIAMMDEALIDVRQTVGVLKREMASMQRVLDVRGHEINEFVRVREFNELHRNLEMLKQRVDTRETEGGRTHLGEKERNPIPMYHGKRKDLSAFLTLFFNWAVSQNVEGALKSEVSVVMTTQKSRNDLYGEYGRELVDKSLTVWNALNKAVEKDNVISTMVIRAKSPSDAWKLLTSMVESDDSDLAVESAKKEFNGLEMNIGETAREYITRAKGLAAAVKHHGVEIDDKQLEKRF